MSIWKSLFGSVFLLVGVSLAALPACSDDDTEACQEGAFNCNGQTLQKCVDGSFVDEETCGMGTMCMASMGHCHSDGGGHSSGGHSAGGHSAGGHSAGGHSSGGMHMGGHMGGMHMGGGGMGGGG